MKYFHFYFLSFLCPSVVFWIGDLNYRISNLDVKYVKELISKKDFEALHSYDQVTTRMVSSFSSLKVLLFIFGTKARCLPLACDPQLKRQIDEEAVFVGFVEGELNFQPTYKYDTGSDTWDTR